MVGSVKSSSMSFNGTDRFASSSEPDSEAVRPVMMQRLSGGLCRDKEEV
jgi:hypothetical protein